MDWPQLSKIMLKDIVNKLRKLPPDVMEGKVLAVVGKNSKAIIAMNKEQLMSGQDATGEFLTPPYKSDRYAEYKLTLNPLGVVDLRLKGDFQNGFFLNANRFPVYIFSTDDKTRKLVGKYGIDIFGLDETNQTEVNTTFVLPEVKGVLFKALHI